jgi:putative addiction module component (TIGR02574 family)
MTTALQDLETLSVPERVQIVEDLWDSIARSNANLPVPQWQKDELARRKQRFLQQPECRLNPPQPQATVAPVSGVLS